MIITAAKFENAIMCANKVLECSSVFDGASSRIPISVDAVTDYIKDDQNVSIEIREVKSKSSYVKGRNETFNDGRVCIDIDSGLSDSWKRFVAIKELMHILVDNDEDDLTPYGDHVLESLVTAQHIGGFWKPGGGQPLQSELAAEVAAIEVIYPFILRKSDADDFKNPKSGTTSSILSLKYKAPDPIISTALNDEYMGFVQSTGNQ